MSQEKIFLEVEAEAWFRRNPSSMVAANPDDPVLAALAAFDLPNRGAMLDVGGASGRIAAGFVRDHLGWSVRVVEPSGAAIAAGRQAFPQVEFRKGSITQVLPAGPHDSQYNVIVVSFVFCFLERDLLSSAISNTDSALADGGYLVIADFDSPHPRANPYAHHPGLFTYK